jgi:DNA modification methylase
MNDAAAWSDISPRSLIEEYTVPPFSVLDSRQGYWQSRRKLWLDYGLARELHARTIEAGRNKHGESAGNVMSLQQTTSGDRQVVSVFDPVLAEIAYRWWCPQGGSVLDPFAGGSVRGVVASVLGHEYVGVDISDEQVQANRNFSSQLDNTQRAAWFTGDSRHLADVVGDRMFDMVFTCPPYYDLEVYGANPQDLSNAKTYAEFLVGYRSAIRQSVEKLRDNRFICIVVGEARDKSGSYYGLVPDTIQAMRDCGVQFHNDLVLVNSVGSLPLRVGNYMRASRKVGKVHQNVIVGVKGRAQTRTWSLERPSVPDVRLGLWEEDK